MNNQDIETYDQDAPMGGEIEAALDAGQPSVSLTMDERPETPLDAYSEAYQRPIEKSEDPFKCLGHNNGVFYFLTKKGGQILPLTNQGGIKGNPFMLAENSWWVKKYPKLDDKGNVEQDKVGWTTAINNTIQDCYQAGVFKSDLRVRGAGVWRDKDDIAVINCGQDLVFMNAKRDSYNFKSYYIYSSSEAVFQYADRALDDAESVKFLELMQKPSWKKGTPAGKLAAGWAVMSMICGYLKWRPHIWITGVRGSGKSWVINNIIGALLDPMALNIISGATEAGLRQLMGTDTRPVLLDEAESTTLKDSEILQSILMSIRRSSSGAIMPKGSQNGKASVYQMTSSYCLGSIYHSLTDPADLSRISLLEIEIDEAKDARERFKVLKKDCAELLTPEYSKRMLRRMVDNICAVNQNLNTFQDALSDAGYEARAADQISALLTGVRMLVSTRPISDSNAREWVRSFDFKKYTSAGEAKDYEDILDVFFTRLIKIFVTSKNTHKEIQIYHSIRIAFGIETGFDADDAERSLKNLDIKVEGDGVYFRKPSEHLNALFKGTRANKNWINVLLGIPGSREVKNKRVSVNPGAAIFIPREFFEEHRQPTIADHPEIGVF